MHLPGTRLIAIPPALAAGTGFILTMMCLFAGSAPNYREDMDLLTLNTSMLGINIFQADPGTESSSSSDDLFGSVGSKVSDISKGIAHEIQSKLQDGIEDIASQLNISDFYSWHILDHCYGNFDPGPLINDTNPDPSKNVIGCSNKTAFYNFNTTQFLQQTLRTDINLTSLIPQDVNDAIEGAMTAARAMFVLYTLAAALSGVAMFTGFVAIISHHRLGASINATIDMLAFLSLGLASSISTGVINKVTDGVNSIGSDIGLTVNKGYKFILVSWMATMVMLIAWAGWMLDFWLAKRRKAKALAPKKEMADYSGPHPDDRVYMNN